MATSETRSQHRDSDPSRAAHLTKVELTWNEDRIERWIRFGHPVEDRIVDPQRRNVFFAPHSVFAFVRWQGNDFGTVLSRIDILRAVLPKEAHTKVAFVNPGAEILLRASGWPKVNRVLDQIDAIEQAAFDPTEVCPDHWSHVHNRLSAGEEPRSYTAERHAVWLKRRALSP